MKRTFLWALVCLIMTAAGSNASRDKGSWKKPLHDKALIFEKTVAERHNIMGSYPSSVALVPPKHYAGLQEGAWDQIVNTGELPEGWTFDHGTTGPSNIAHTSSWTGCYLTSQAFRVAFLRNEYGEDSEQYKEAYARANEVIHSLRILTLVSGQPGYLCRGVALGHGISYEERANVDTRDLWGQGVGEFSHLRYRGGPSHHNYDHVFRGLGMYYFIGADDAQKEAIREIVEDMSNWAHLKNNMIIRHIDNKRESTVIIGGWRGMGGDDRPSGGSVLGLSGLKIAYSITGNKKVERLYNHWTKELGFTDPSRNQTNIMGEARSNYDDTDHLLGSLYLMNLLEKDPELLAFYHKCIKDSWAVHKEERAAWFNYVYRSVLGDEFADPDGSLWYLQTHPINRLFVPQMNSIRTDIEFTTVNGRKEALHPLPMYERPSDNEYAWKGSPYRLDSWGSRTITVYEIAPYDPYVQFASDTGAAYYSNTKGEIWHEMPGLPRVNDFLFAPDYPWIAFAATNSGIYRTMTQGASWSRVYSTATTQLMFDPNNPFILYAVGPHGVYKSEDLNELGMGTTWRSLTDPVVSGAVYGIDINESLPILFRMTRHGFYSKEEGDTEWKAYPYAVRTRGFGDVDGIGGDPLWIKAHPNTKGRIFRAVQMRQREYTGPWISVSDNWGRTWQPILRELNPLIEWSTGTGTTSKMTRDQMKHYFGLMSEFHIQEMVLDSNDPDTWYGRLDNAIAITHDAGKTWTKSAHGLDIPVVRSLWKPRHSNLIAVGTPAGMYVSNDGGKSWESTSLILNGRGTLREEIGSAGYLTAYWMGRYHGFITQDEASKTWWNN